MPYNRKCGKCVSLTQRDADVLLQGHEAMVHSEGNPAAADRLSNGLPAYTGNGTVSTVCRTTRHVAGFYFSKQKWTRVSGFSAGAWRLLSQETETQRWTNLLQVSLRREAVLILAHASRPNQQIFFFCFFQTCWL